MDVAKTIGGILGMIVVAIVVVNFFGPLNTAIATANLTGTEGVIVGMLGLILAVVLLLIFVKEIQ